MCRLVFPSFAFGEIHPLVALSNDRGISDSAESDQRYARWIGASLLGKGLTENDCPTRHEPTDKSKFEKIVIS